MTDAGKNANQIEEESVQINELHFVDTKITVNS